MGSVFIQVAQLLLSLSLLVILHELGHFIPAKLFKTRVEKFYLFFDIKFSLFKKKIGETVYGIGWLPLGGYVKISGMVDESMDTEQLKQEPQPWEFRSKPAWQRLIIMIGGVVVNFVLGLVIYTGILANWGSDYTHGEDVKYGFGITPVLESHGFQQGDKIISINREIPKNDLEINKNLLVRNIKTITVKHQNGLEETINLPSDIGSEIFKTGAITSLMARYPFELDTVLPNSPAYKAGIRKGDKILTLDGNKIEYQSDFINTLHQSLKNKTQVPVSYIRNEITQNTTLDFSPKRKSNFLFDLLYNLFKIEFEEKVTKAGVSLKPTDKEFMKIHHKDYSFTESISGGISKGYWTLKDYIAQFKYLFTKQGASQMGGFMAIGKMFTPVWNWLSFWNTTAFISIMLAFMNILPIPALDGGHIVFLIYEMITRRKPSDKVLEYAQMVGIVILLSLMVYANVNDVIKSF